MFLVLAVPLYLCNQCGAFWVQMCPAVRDLWFEHSGLLFLFEKYFKKTIFVDFFISAK